MLRPNRLRNRSTFPTRFEKTDWELDHPLHTYKYVEFITEPTKVEGTIDDFLERIGNVPNTYPF